MRILVFTASKEGHYPEFLAHLRGLAQAHPEDEFIFVEREVPEGGSKLRYAWRLCRLLRKAIRENRADRAFLVMLMRYSPVVFLPLFGKARIAGVIYPVWLYTWKTDSPVRKALNAVTFWMMARARNLRHVFVLNDNAAAQYWNRLYRTDKFKFLCDPLNPIPEVTARYGLREKYPDKLIVCHPGALKRRKGTCDILDFIEGAEASLLDRYVFVFAGKAQESGIDARIRAMQEEYPIVYYPGFLSDAELGEIISSSDLMLLPYHNTNQSSGVIGYAAEFNVPVAVPGEYLLGKLVRRNGLGFLMAGHDARAIGAFLESFEKPAAPISRQYLETNSAERFCAQIYNYIRQ